MSAWDNVAAWLRSDDSAWLADEACMGTLPLYEAEALLDDFGIPATRRNLRALGQEIELALLAA